MYNWKEKADLSKVTLVCIDTVCHDLTIMAIDDCMSKATFGDVKVFSNKNIWHDTVIIDEFANLTEAGNFTVNEVPKHIKTDFVLFIHWDSWIIDSGMWKPEFLAYDYIGAPWWYKDNFNVGNSGFCIRSKELIDFLARNKEEFPLKMPEDHVLCRQYQKQMPQFRWASTKIAQEFSFERVRPAIDSRHFGFHGIFNWPFVLAPDQLAKRMQLARQNQYLKDSGMLIQINHVWEKHWLANN